MTEETKPVPVDDQPVQWQFVEKLLDRFSQAIDETDEAAAAERISQIRAKHADEDADRLAERLIFSKARETALVGATTSAAMIVPGLGTIAGLTLGIAADLGVTFKLQAELVLELAALNGHTLSPAEKQRVVMLVTGLSAGTTTLAHRAGKNISSRLTARIGSKYVTKALPVVGAAASASTNAVMTYVIGQRAHAYFSLGEEAMQDWRLTAGALTGLNRELIAAGVNGGVGALKAAGSGAVSGVKKAGARLTRRRRRKKAEDVPAFPDEEIIPMLEE